VAEGQSLAYTRQRLRGIAQCLCRIQSAAGPVNSTIPESAWTADMSSFATLPMLLCVSRRFKLVVCDVVRQPKWPVCRIHRNGAERSGAGIVEYEAGAR
jgi:hypothetical protein